MSLDLRRSFLQSRGHIYWAVCHNSVLLGSRKALLTDYRTASAESRDNLGILVNMALQAATI